MDLAKIIRELSEEREQLSRIIQSLEQLNNSSAKFGFPPEARRGRKSMDAEARMEVSARMKKYWESRREGKGTSG